MSIRTIRLNRGTLFQRARPCLDIVHAPTALKAARYRAPGSSEFKESHWTYALDRSRDLMMTPRQVTFIAKDRAGTGQSIIITGMLAASLFLQREPPTATWNSCAPW